MPIMHRYDFPDRFVAGTLGDPGQRVFFLQARQGNRLTNVVCEKQQVQVLAEHLERILDELSKLSEGALNIPPSRPTAHDLAPLDVPLDEDFRAGTMTIAWDANVSAVQVELYSVDEEGNEPADFPFTGDDDTASSSEALEVKMSPEQARDFAARARSLISAGRPACPFCAQPIEPEGHICPRANGYRKALFG